MLALTSQSMAVAKGASAAAGQMVLCTGTGPMAIYVDADGLPTSAPHICPDSALNVVFSTELPAAKVMQRMVFFVPHARRKPQIMHRGVINTPPSRAPPAII